MGHQLEEGVFTNALEEISRVIHEHDGVSLLAEGALLDLFGGVHVDLNMPAQLIAPLQGCNTDHAARERPTFDVFGFAGDATDGATDGTMLGGPLGVGEFNAAL